MSSPDRASGRYRAARVLAMALLPGGCADPTGLTLRYRVKGKRYDAILEATPDGPGVLLDIGPDNPQLRAQVTTAIMPLIDGERRSAGDHPDDAALAELKALGYVE
jgi:hypothetical protein